MFNIKTVTVMVNESVNQYDWDLGVLQFRLIPNHKPNVDPTVGVGEM